MRNTTAGEALEKTLTARTAFMGERDLLKEERTLMARADITVKVMAREDTPMVREVTAREVTARVLARDMILTARCLQVKTA